MESGQIEITEKEIQDKSKGDTVSKVLAVVQTGWFVLQCLARWVEHLPVTELELATLAFATLSFATYGFWWYKPLNVQCPYLVGRKNRPDLQREGKEVEAKQKGEGRGWLWAMMPFLDISFGRDIPEGAKGVPTFYSGSRTDFGPYLVPAIGMIFGAIYCIAWSFQFPSPIEQSLWRGSSLAITCAPVASTVAVVIVAIMSGSVTHSDGDEDGDDKDPNQPRNTFIMSLGPILYIIARITLVVLSFTSLRSLPIEAYQVVHWTTFIPHMH